MRSRMALGLTVAALVVSAALPATISADTPQYAGTFTGWKCLVQAPVANCDIEITGGDAWSQYPLADFAGMSVSALQTPNNVAVLKILMNIRQVSNFPGDVGPIAIDPSVATLLGPTLTADLKAWFAADAITQGLAGGAVPPVPGGGGTPDPSLGVYCYFWPYASPAPTKPGTCIAPPATVDASGVVQWPGYPTSVTQPAAPPPAPAAVVSSTVQAVTAAVESQSAPSASSSSGSSGTNPPKASTVQPVPPAPPTSNPTNAQGVQEAAAQTDKPTPATGVCQKDKGNAIPCTQDPAYAAPVTPQKVATAKETLHHEASVNRARAPWRNVGAVALMLGLLLLIAGGITALVRRPERWGDTVFLPRAHRVGRAMLIVGAPLLVIGAAVYLTNPLIQ